ncbi:hypothetical protein PG994_008899 [Apiospora phragmitis]|uniref:Uncharacterized protein n=1 Tax=Apiospora phragmitis TaxID=2905665 RepID=A0ABR1UHS2_9PEZI
MPQSLRPSIRGFDSTSGLTKPFWLFSFVHGPEAASIGAARALELAFQVHNAKRGGSDDNSPGTAANGTSVMDSRAAKSTCLAARSSTAGNAANLQGGKDIRDQLDEL